MGSVAGKELQILLSEKDEITGIENYDEFLKELAPSPMPGMDMSKMFSKDSITQMIKSGGIAIHARSPCETGDSWPLSTTVELPQLGKIAIKGTYTFKGLGDHGGNQCAEIAADAKLEMDLSGKDASSAGASPLSQLGLKVQDGALRARFGSTRSSAPRGNLK